jgi:RNA polymerase sigma factor (sigma-70 family)
VTRIVRDRDLAGEIVQSTFTKAWDELRAGHELRHPKAWLYAVARNRALDETRRRRVLTDDPPIYSQVDPSRLSDPQAVAEDNELVELVWDSAGALNPDEYALLDLHVRHGFGAADLADALHLERGAVYTRLSRLRSSLEESVASTLLVRRGSEDCAGLAAIVAEHGGGEALTPELRRAVRAHVKECEICSDARRRIVNPVALFGALVPVVPLAGMREGILPAILPGGAASAAGGGAAAATTGRQVGKAKYIAGAGGVAAAATIVAIALSPGGGVRDPTSATSLDHRVGVPSSDATVTMRWPPGQKAHGYSVMFSRNRSAEPPARENVSGRQYTSSPLSPGRWWFILRTHGSDGGWTHTLRVGPFIITAATARAATPVKKAPAKRAEHRQRRDEQTLALRTTPAPATIVAAARRAPPAKPTPKSRAPTPPTKEPTSAPKKPKPVRTPPAAGTPPIPVPVPPAQQPPAQGPPVSPPPTATDEDDEHNDDDDDDQGEDEGGAGHGHAGHGHADHGGEPPDRSRNRTA